MKVIDHKPYVWFLLEHEGNLFLDANCNHSFFGYSYMIILSADELSEYKSVGRDFLTKLADDIHNSVPIIIGSKSKYIGRDVSREFSDLLLPAIESWKKLQIEVCPPRH